MRVFVTVGATAPFDLLVEAVLSDSVRSALLEKGYDQLVVQAGPSERFHESHEKHGDLTIQLWKLKPSLNDDLELSDLVISHAGALCFGPFANPKPSFRLWFDIGCAAAP
jgi:beta-1,4-N-acetylglucosaminyltransferase